MLQWNPYRKKKLRKAPSTPQIQRYNNNNKNYNNNEHYKHRRLKSSQTPQRIHSKRNLVRRYSNDHNDSFIIPSTSMPVNINHNNSGNLPKIASLSLSRPDYSTTQTAHDQYMSMKNNNTNNSHNHNFQSMDDLSFGSPTNSELSLSLHSPIISPRQYNSNNYSDYNNNNNNIYNNNYNDNNNNNNNNGFASISSTITNSGDDISDYDITNCIEQPPPYLLCAICGHIARDAVRTNICDHTFCQEHIYKWLSEPGQKCCPVDQESLELSQLREDQTIRAQIANLKIKCPANKCTSDPICLGDMPYHRNKECICRPIKCQICGKKMLALNLHVHMRSESELHTDLLIKENQKLREELSDARDQIKQVDAYRSEKEDDLKWQSASKERLLVVVRQQEALLKEERETVKRLESLLRSLNKLYVDQVDESSKLRKRIGNQAEIQIRARAEAEAKVFADQESKYNILNVDSIYDKSVEEVSTYPKYKISSSVDAYTYLYSPTHHSSTNHKKNLKNNHHHRTNDISTNDHTSNNNNNNDIHKSINHGAHNFITSSTSVPVISSYIPSVKLKKKIKKKSKKKKVKKKKSTSSKRSRSAAHSSRHNKHRKQKKPVFNSPDISKRRFSSQSIDKIPTLELNSIDEIIVGAPFKWSTTLKHPLINVTNNGYGAVNRVGFAAKTIVGDVIWSAGRHCWGISLKKCYGAVIGVVPSEVDGLKRGGLIGVDIKGWGVEYAVGRKICYFDDQDNHKEKKIDEKFCQGFHGKDINMLGILLDLDHGFIEFFRDTVSLGVAFTNITGSSVRPAVTLLFKNDTAVLTKFQLPVLRQIN